MAQVAGGKEQASPPSQIVGTKSKLKEDGNISNINIKMTIVCLF
jgi:hypothetical protein